jgi:hypothetical protein
MDRPADPTFEFDVALSFAGEDRAYVQEVAEAMKAADVTVFLDSDHEAEMWGEDLVEFFQRVYTVRAKYAILFVSCQYATKAWPRAERRAALARALEQRAAYVLPIRMDDTDLPGLEPTVHYIDARRVGIDGIVRALSAKLAATPDSGTTSGVGVPRGALKAKRILAERPPAWEYLYFAAVLESELELRNPKFQDQQLHYAAQSGVRVTDREVQPFVKQALDDVGALTTKLARVMDPALQERAIGLPGEPGDASRIQHLASRWNAVYEELLDWAAAVRGVSAPAAYRRLFEIVASVVDQPLQEYRDFVFAYVEEMDRLPDRLATGDPIVIDLKLTLTMDDEVLQNYKEELARLLQH